MPGSFVVCERLFQLPNAIAVFLFDARPLLTASSAENDKRLLISVQPFAFASREPQDQAPVNGRQFLIELPVRSYPLRLSNLSWSPPGRIAINLWPSCLISCSQPSPSGGLLQGITIWMRMSAGTPAGIAVGGKIIGIRARRIYHNHQRIKHEFKRYFM
jgi:hypothetical protein